jgi:ABC-type transport system involved in cytochrome c biogenesis ATPase subunit
MIETRGLCKRFGPLTVLQAVDVSLGRGRITALVGPNGAGKTTLLKSILGLTRPDSGVILFDGTPLGDDESFRARIGYMPQTPRFPGNLTGAELYAMLRDLRGDARPADDALFAAFALDTHMQKPVRTLSGGTLQKINAALAFAFLSRPAHSRRADRRPRPGLERDAQGQDPRGPRCRAHRDRDVARHERSRGACRRCGIPGRGAGVLRGVRVGPQAGDAAESARARSG